MEQFRVNSVERGSRFDGTPSYTVRGRDINGNPAVFTVPRQPFPQLEGIRDREPGTTIMVSREDGRVTGIKITQPAKKADNHAARKQRRGRRGGFVHF